MTTIMFDDDSQTPAQHSQEEVDTNQKKQDFIPPSERVTQTAKKSNVDEEQQSKIVDEVNKKLQGTGGSKPKIDTEDAVHLTKLEEDVLEQMLFNGYAVYDIPLGFKDRRVTIASQTPADTELVEYMVKKFYNRAVSTSKLSESDSDKKTPIQKIADEVDDNVITERTLMSKRNIYNMALYVVGFDGEDFAEKDRAHCTLNVVKKAYKVACDKLDSGDLKAYKELMDSIVDIMHYRASVINGWGSIMHDTINLKRNEFEDKLYLALNPKKDKALPKF